MINGITHELRAFALRSVCLAGECSDRELSQALEDLAADLAPKAAELNRRFDR